MNDPKFPKVIDYEALKREYGEDENLQKEKTESKYQRYSKRTPPSKYSSLNDEDNPQPQQPGMKGTRLRSYAFAVLTRKEYSKKDLIEKLCLYAEDREEVLMLVDELSRENYQSDQRVAEMTVRSQIRKGKGPNRIKLALNAKSIDKALAKNDMDEIDWYEQAYMLKVKKYGTEVTIDAKMKAKQIRFLQYRGFEMDAIMKAIRKRED
ncbi:RecX family transcriptional regulator [Acinetobacter sp. TGL-Y2]|uniref:regulatory protein RecX n=1 Tax=Acinetobacter sp. TGL-Y2 TaxID=1407071 RepID=UPI0007A65006|nr:regulatory protein RecX [Acinetobacter sp. TGL-Y2]AMW78977.1 RecX family transcriptional regulator [Acinetobacter sp. TGL-Y2]